jgi:hypothetical protein
MNRTARYLGITLLLAFGLGVPGVRAQQPVAAEPQAPSGTVQAPREVVPPLPVPRLVKFAGVLKDELGKPRTGVVGVTFAIYKEQEGGAALWLETQNVELDDQGRYTVLLGSSKSEGLPLELFTAGEPRWLGVQVNLPKEVEQSRVLLVSVPYALKASDADTLGGKPASVYLTTEQGGGIGTSGKTNGGAGIVSSAVGGTGSTNVVPKWLDNVGTLGNSQITDDGTNVSMPGNVGALAYKFTGNATPPTDATATIFNQAFVGPVFSGLSFKVRTGAPVPADALSIDTSQNASITGNASALAYKFTGNANPPTDATATIFNQANVGPVFSGLSFKVRTGAPVPADALSIDPSQNVSVVKGNLMLSGAGNAIVFSDGTVQSTAVKGTGGGTITGVTAGTGLSGGGTTGGVTLSVPNGGITNSMLAANAITNTNIADGSLAPAKIAGTAATLGVNNFAGNQVVIGDLTISNPTSVNSENVLHVVGNNGSQTTVKIEAAQPFLMLNNTTSNTRLLGIGFTSSSQALPNTWTIEADPGGFNADKLDFIDKNGVQRLELNGDAGTAAISASTSISGNLALPNTTSSSVGVLTLGGAPFLHNFGTANTFVGALAGNTSASLTGGFNTAVGANALLSNTTGNTNSAFGAGALQLNTIGLRNSAFGFDALLSNTTGMQNSAFGKFALIANTTGSNNSAFGIDALENNTTGSGNAAFGASVLVANTGDNNSAFGISTLVANTTGFNNSAFGIGALGSNTTGMQNSAFGSGALQNLTSGDLNTAIGAGAGNSLTSGSSNIYIANSGAGAGSESNTIRIGAVGTQTAAFMAGISGATSASGVAVLVNPSGQLGTTTSSRRFKYEIADIGGESDLLMKLRPVAFYYKPELDETQTRQYGLVAEEVAKVAPQLVVFDKDGTPQTVRYHFVNAMLLNEVQKQRQLIEEQQKTNEEQHKTIARQQAEIQDLAARLAKLEAALAAR